MATQSFSLAPPTRDAVVTAARTVWLSWADFFGKLARLYNARLVATETADPVSIPANAFVQVAVAVTGAALGERAQATFSAITSGVLLHAHMTAVGVATVTFQNITGAPIDLPVGTLRVFVDRNT